MKAAGHTIACDYVVIATHTPLIGKTNLASATLFQTKLSLYSSYVLGGRVPTGTIPDALYWDTAEPYHYLRLDRHRDYDYVIFGGQDHKTGQAADTEACYGALQRTLTGVPQIAIRPMVGEVPKKHDGLHFIGGFGRQFAATGIRQRHDVRNDRRHVARDGASKPESLMNCSIGCRKIREGAGDYLKENRTLILIRDRFAGARVRGFATGERQGKILEIREKASRLAQRHRYGKVCRPSSTGCMVLERAEPHGSAPPRFPFKPNGDVCRAPRNRRSKIVGGSVETAPTRSCLTEPI